MIDFPAELPASARMIHRSGTRALDVAKGVLVALRRHDADQTFTELVRVGERYGLSPFALATALVAAASGAPDSRGANADAASAVQREWGSLLSCAPQPSSR